MALEPKDAPLVIWGAGAIGGTIGAYLARAGHAVLFVDTATDHVARINDHGLTVTGPIDRFTIAVEAVTPEALVGVFPRIILAVKTPATAAASHAPAVPFIGARPVVTVPAWRAPVERPVFSAGMEGRKKPVTMTAFHPWQGDGAR